MGDDHFSIDTIEAPVGTKRVSDSTGTQFLSTAEAARMLGLSTTLVQTLVDQGDLKGWKTRGGHRRISLTSIDEYQSASRSTMGVAVKSVIKPRITVVVEDPDLLQQLMSANEAWNFPVEVTFFDSVTEALLELSTRRPDMMVVEMSMPRLQQEKTLQALENFNSRGRSPLSVVLVTAETDLLSSSASHSPTAIQVVSGPVTRVWMHAYLTGVVASCKI
ncbi:helix-turn-helix domain-containing protein [Limnohabitans lacus]|jgi:excisionase family DNA binding protein|uniref:Helix-turn-helix domain-containing protein n=1 Tax=Limnohabitans lacus TaxID=3045173 RepID=A0ABT6X8N2_9BURK|nr:helix-turn-helix domain-containing protein [Limnohabitans sp. HM2-2]MDI9234470.1 helix-turn-helix domain-containing protein [Limnohabitans sp. HM2-2]